MQKSPRHIAIILDGNRRYARRLGKNELTGHTDGLRNLLRIAKAARARGVREMTVYALSIQNLQRGHKELHHLFGLLKTAAKRLGDSKEAREGTLRVRIAGNVRLLPPDMRVVAKNVEKKTAKGDGFTLTLAIGYGGREEILNAARAFATKAAKGALKPADITEEAFGNELWAKGTPDLVIRTGGDVRTSNFLPWQTIYSEWFFEKKMWPQFSETDLDRIIAAFARRARRFGK